MTEPETVMTVHGRISLADALRNEDARQHYQRMEELLGEILRLFRPSVIPTAALPLLLAVAKAVVEPDTAGCCLVCGLYVSAGPHHAAGCPIGALTTAHPGWREWTP